MAKIVCVLYADPVGGYPKSYARDDLPKIDRYPGGQTLPTPKAIDFKPGTLLGSVSGELGLRKYLESLGHTFVVTADKDGPKSVFERELLDAQRATLIRLRNDGKVDNTVMRSIQRLLDLEAEEMAILETSGHTESDVSGA